jgi:hypothetical protein
MVLNVWAGAWLMEAQRRQKRTSGRVVTMLLFTTAWAENQRTNRARARSEGRDRAGESNSARLGGLKCAWGACAQLRASDLESLWGCSRGHCSLWDNEAVAIQGPSPSSSSTALGPTPSAFGATPPQILPPLYPSNGDAAGDSCSSSGAVGGPGPGQYTYCPPLVGTMAAGRIQRNCRPAVHKEHDRVVPGHHAGDRRKRIGGQNRSPFDPGASADGRWRQDERGAVAIAVGGAARTGGALQLAA